MSFNRENIVWPSKDGSWNRGFFTFYNTSSGEDHDPEWDVDYDWNSFWWVSTGHATEDEAHAAWDGANPGGCQLVHAYADDPEWCDQLDKMAADLQEYQRQRKKENWPVGRTLY